MTSQLKRYKRIAGSIFEPSLILQVSDSQKQSLLESNLDYFRVYFTPASGPRFLASSGFDYKLRKAASNNELCGEKWLIGASTGALRHLAIVSSILTYRDVTLELCRNYINMYYKEGDDPSVLEPMMYKAFNDVAPFHIIDDILNHSQFRIGIIVCKINSPFDQIPNTAFLASLMGFCVANIVHPKSLDYLAEKICFYTGSKPPDFIDDCGSPIRFVPLTKNNLYQVLHATTSIPYISKPCTFIDGAGSGKFLDGGLKHYYSNLKLKNNTPALLVSDQEKTYRTAFDYFDPFQRRIYVDDSISVVKPSREYLELVKRLPGVGDWFDKEYIRDPKKRHSHWKYCYDLSVKSWDDNFSDPFIFNSKQVRSV